MNETISAEERAWMDSAGRALRAAEGELDAMTLMRLRAARARAVAAAAQAPAAMKMNWGLPLALAAGLMTWTLLPRLTMTTPAVAPAGAEVAVETLDILTDERSPEFYQDLDFYLWMKEHREHA